MFRKLTTCNPVRGKYLSLGNHRGVAAIEMALMLPILLLLVLGIIDFGLLMYRQQVITNASREGARQGIVLANPRPTEGDVENVVSNYLASANLDTSIADVAVNGAGGPTGTNLTVTINYPNNFIVLNNFVPALPNPFPLNAATTMVLE